MFWVTLSAIVCFLDAVLGHGMMLHPPSRSSLWRTNSNAEKNYDDNAVLCGGFGRQFSVNGGHCGVCGDDFSDPHPQDNENTGKYGQGIIGATYKAGSVIEVQIVLTANHKGSFNYSLCALDDPIRPEIEECFAYLMLENGKNTTTVDADKNLYVENVQLPPYLTCERCVFRWTYRAGNNWGYCDDGTGSLGCGPQEHFRNCADISIV